VGSGTGDRVLCSSPSPGENNSVSGRCTGGPDSRSEVAPQGLADERTKDAVGRAPEPRPMFDPSAISGLVTNISNTIIMCRIARAVTYPLPFWLSVIGG